MTAPAPRRGRTTRISASSLATNEDLRPECHERRATAWGRRLVEGLGPHQRKAKCLHLRVMPCFGPEFSPPVAPRGFGVPLREDMAVNERTET